MTDRVGLAVGAVVVRDGRLLLVERANEPAAGLWAVPGGRVEAGESLLDAVKREVAEETGLFVAVGDVAWVGESIGPGTPPAWHYVILDYWASVEGGTLQAGGDARLAEWVPLNRLGERPMVNTMHDLIGRLWDSP
ncbi:MAG: NUDIX domain-containing protein [Acidimicrobiia bacterium]|nr:NUDIX domain-containing protein [Acidimicrobiia bacterium]NNL71611.1 NUDIX domain-containing protein [Acidimicrobiia bacterium]